MTFHTPVMVQECLSYLNLRAGHIYVDATTGGGGHSLAMLKAQPEIKLYCFDQDIEAIEEAGKKLNNYPNVELIHSNFKQLRTELAYRKVKGIDGILFDLGVSSHQLESAERGFSFEKDAPLDMRMDKNLNYNAYNAVNELDAKTLTRIFRDYGEEQNAYRIAKAIEKSPKPIKTTSELAKIVESVAGKGTKTSLKTKVRIFQALRIYVNKELEFLSLALQDAINLLNPQGRIVVLSYHSLEDRIVKQTFKKAEQDNEKQPVRYNSNNNYHRQLIILTKKPVTATEEEILVNPRSRSAKLRAGEKVQRENREIKNSRKPSRQNTQEEK